MCVFKRSGSLWGGVVVDRAWGGAGEEDSGGYCISLMRKVMVALSRGWRRGRGRKGWDLFVDETDRTLLCTDSRGEGKEKIRDDSWLICLTVWVAMHSFPGRGTLWRWGIVREAILVNGILIILELRKESGRMN